MSCPSRVPVGTGGQEPRVPRTNAIRDARPSSVTRRRPPRPTSWCTGPVPSASGSVDCPVDRCPRENGDPPGNRILGSRGILPARFRGPTGRDRHAACPPRRRNAGPAYSPARIQPGPDSLAAYRPATDGPSASLRTSRTRAAHRAPRRRAAHDSQVPAVPTGRERHTSPPNAPLRPLPTVVPRPAAHARTPHGTVAALPSGAGRTSAARRSAAQSTAARAVAAWRTRTTPSAPSPHSGAGGRGPRVRSERCTAGPPGSAQNVLNAWTEPLPRPAFPAGYFGMR
jgi:hypothetical protein